jgi:DNA-binding IclR family transcriptional regulator
MAKSVQAVERACDLMFLIASSKSGLGVSELAASLGLSKSTVHRLLVALGNKSMIQQDPLTQRHSLHPRVLELAVPFQSQQDIVAAVRPHLDALRDRFQETTILALRVGFSFMSVAHSPSPFEFRFIPTIGRQMSLHWGAFGKAILAYLPAEELAEFFQRVPLVPTTSQTIVNATLLQEELCEIRERGFAKSVSEVLDGQIGIAACILDHCGKPTGCIGLGGPELRLRHHDLDEIGNEILAAARHVSNAWRLRSQ